MLNRPRFNWPPKLASLLAAVVIWYLLHQAIRSQPGAEPSRPVVPPSGRFP